MKTEKFKYSVRSLSRDLRTNVWDFTCLKCNKNFSTETTVLAVQKVTCPKCGEQEVINYND